MTGGIAVELSVGGPGDCPVATVSADAGAPVPSVSRATTPDEDGSLAEEFTLPAEATTSHAGVVEVASVGSRDVYRFSREPGNDCVCEAVERIAGPVADVRARDGTLYVSLYAPDLDVVQDVVTELREQFTGVRVRQLARSGDESDPVIVDRGRLTGRQREVLETAHEMGYFEHPKGANAGEVAAELGISSSTFREHLAAAQGKLLDAILDE